MGNNIMKKVLIGLLFAVISQGEGVQALAEETKQEVKSRADLIAMGKKKGHGAGKAKWGKGGKKSPFEQFRNPGDDGTAGTQDGTKLPAKKWGAGGRNSPFEQFRNPNEETEDDDVKATATDEPAATGTGSSNEPQATATDDDGEPTWENAMNAEEEACYQNRYTDLGAMSGNEHYAKIGKKQGRNIRCQHFMTYIMARRYLSRYSELGKAYGLSGKESVQAGQDHWYNNGSKQAPPLVNKVNYPTEEAYKCADYGDECTCPGRVHFGLKYRHDNGDEITTLDDLTDWLRVPYKQGKESKIKCNKHSFKNTKRGDRIKKINKVWKDKEDDQYQCMCEPELKPEPTRCAGLGEMCTCTGNVFYGDKFVENTSKLANFEQMMTAPWTVAEADGHLMCNPENFVYGDPSPGVTKSCYCDSEGVVPDNVVDDQVWYYEGLLEEQRAAEEEARAEAEAEAARQAAAAENAALAASLAEAEAKIKAAEAAYAKAQEDAKKKAEEQAAKDAADAAAAAAAEAAREKALEAEKKKREAEHDAALKAAEAKAKAAAEAKAADQRRALLEEAEEAKAAAIKAEVAAALAAQKEEHDRLMAEQAAKAEADKRAQEAAAAEAKRIEEAEEAREKAIEEAKKKEMIAAMQKAHADELAAQAESAKAAAQKALTAALEKQQEAYEAKMAAEAAERARIAKEEAEEEARQLAIKLAEEKAAEEEKKRLEEEEAQRKAEELAAHNKLIEDEKAAHAAELAAAKAAHDEEIRKAAAAAAAAKAKADAALAKTEGEKQLALAAQKAAEQAQKDAEEAEAAALARKKNLEDEIAHKKMIAALAQKATEEAEAKKKAAQEKAEEWKRLAEETKRKKEAEIAAAEAAAAARKAELEAERKRNKAKHDAALAAQAETYRLASLAAEAAHAAQEAARRAREEEQIAEHKRQMAARRSAFEKAFRNVWATGDTGVSMIHMTAPKLTGDLLNNLFKKTLVADAADVVSNVKKSWNNHGKVIWDQDRHSIQMLTSDDRVAEAIEEVAVFMNKFHEAVPFDLVVTPLATGSKEYIQWVKLQTLKKDDSTAFFNQQADPAMAAETATAVY